VLKLVGPSKVTDILGVTLNSMSSHKISPMPKTVLTDISGEMKLICERLELVTKEVNNVKDAKHAIADLTSHVKLIAKNFGDLTNILLGDAYTYKVITEAQSSQVPVAAREQHMSSIVDNGHEVESFGMSTVTKGAMSSSSDSKSRGSGADSMFRVTAAKSVTSLKSPPRTPNKLKPKSANTPIEVAGAAGVQHSPSPQIVDKIVKSPAKTNKLNA
jgi:hypothetical protein